MNGQNDDGRVIDQADEEAAFRELVAKADECDVLAAQCTQKGNRMMAEHYKQCADDARKQACGFDPIGTMKEFAKSRGRVSVGINQEALDALTEIGVTKQQRARFLARLVEEAIFAYREAGGRQNRFLRLDAKADRTRWEVRFRQHVAATAAAEFALCSVQRGVAPAA